MNECYSLIWANPAVLFHHDRSVVLQASDHGLLLRSQPCCMTVVLQIKLTTLLCYL